MSNYEAQQREQIERLKRVVDGFERIFQGPDNATVFNGTDNLPTIAKLQKDAIFALETVLQDLPNIQEDIDRAVAAASEAESIRDNLMLSGVTIYATEAAGRAAVGDNALFLVNSAVSGVFVDLYQRINSGSSTLLDSYANKAALDAAVAAMSLDLSELQPAGTSFDILSDAYGRVAEEVNEAGVRRLGGLQLNGQFNALPVANLERAMRAYGGAVGGFAQLPWDVNLSASYGQSNSIGAAVGGDTAISTTPYAGLTMPGPQMNQGIEFTGFTKFQAPISAIEENKSVLTSNYNETPCRGFGEVVLDSLARRNGSSYKTHRREVRLCSLGNGGEGIFTLSKNPARTFADYTSTGDGKDFAVVEAFAKDAKDRATALGLSCGMLGVQWHQGADDYDNATSKSAYKAALIQLANDLQTYIGGYLGQHAPIYLFVVQNHAHFARGLINNPVIAEAQAEAALECDTILLVQPQYANLFNGSSVHHRPIGSKVLGGMCGYAAYVTHVLKKDWWNFLPSAVVAQTSTLIRVDYDVPSGHYLDWAYQTDQSPDMRADPNLGFWPVLTGTTTDIALASGIAPWIEGNSVYIQVATTLPANWDLQYGRGTYGGNLCLRPYHPKDEIHVQISGQDQTIFRHAPIFRWEV